LKKLISASSVLTFSAVFGASHALAIEPATVPVGAVDIVPTFGVEHGYNDNLILQPKGGDIIGTQFTVLSPAVQAVLANDTTEYSLNASAAHGMHDRSADDNYTDYTVGAAAAWALNSRNQLALDAAFNSTHEDRGTGFSEGSGAASVPDEYEEATIGAHYTYGSQESIGRLVFDLSRTEKEYTNVEKLLGADHGRNRDTDNAGVSFFWNVGGSTDALVEVTRSDIDYVNEAASSDSLDSELTRVLVGATWEATAKTEGTIKVGRADKNFKDGARNDFDGNTWDISVSWSPMTYSVVSLTSGQEAKDPSGNGSYIDAENIGLTWQHNWSDLVSTNVYFNQSDEEYVDSTDDRKDTTTGYGVGVDYQVRRWLSVGVSTGYSDRDSNVSDYEFKQNITALNVQLSL